MKHNFYHVENNEDGLPILVKEEKKYYADKRFKYNSPERINELCKGINLDKMAEEYVYAVYLNAALHLIGFSEVSHGTVDYSVISPREVFQKALLLGAKNVILIHNHPSGCSNPSTADIDITKRLNDAGNIIGISILDHMIICEDEYYSFKNEQLL